MNDETPSGESDAREPRSGESQTDKSRTNESQTGESQPDRSPAGESETADSTDASPGHASSGSLWRNTAFRRFFAGQFVTNAGDSLYSVAVLWIVFDLTGSSTLVGVANATLLLPFLLQIVAGPVVDRLRADRLLVGTQLLQGIVVLAFPLAAVTGRLTVEVVFLTVPVLALAATVMGPLRAAIVPRILPDSQLSRGNAALATVTLGLDMVFDAVSGVVTAAVGVTALFLADAATFGLAAALFAATAIPRVDSEPSETNEPSDENEVSEPSEPSEPSETNEPSEPSEPNEENENATPIADYVADLRAGIDTLRGSTFVTLVGLNATFHLALGVTLTTLPAFGAALAGPTIGGLTLAGPAVYGGMLGALGVGRLVGSLLAPRLDDIPYGRLRGGTALAAAVAWLGAALSPSVPVTVGLFGSAWIAAGLAGVLTTTINQRVFPSAVLGRISAIKGTASTATLPVGALLGGWVADAVGPRTVLAVTAAGFGIVGTTFVLRPSLRRLPPVSTIEPADLRLSFDAVDAGGAADATAEPDGTGDATADATETTADDQRDGA